MYQMEGPNPKFGEKVGEKVWGEGGRVLVVDDPFGESFKYCGGMEGDDLLVFDGDVVFCPLGLFGDLHEEAAS
jgi:hypothetical protein